jgi:hypothetical protein
MGVRVTWDDLRAALAEVEPGEYRTAQLLPTYNTWAEREGKPTLTTKALGEAIARETCLNSRHGHGHIRLWTVDRKGLECRNWHTAS